MSGVDGWFPHFIPEVMHRTRRLTLEEEGAVTRLLHEIWTFGPIEDDNAVIARTIGCTVRAWTTRLRASVARLFQIVDGRWHHPLLQQRRAEACAAAQARAEGGARGGRAKAANRQARAAEPGDNPGINSGKLPDKTGVFSENVNENNDRVLAGLQARPLQDSESESKDSSFQEGAPQARAAPAAPPPPPVPPPVPADPAIVPQPRTALTRAPQAAPMPGRDLVNIAEDRGHVVALPPSARALVFTEGLFILRTLSGKPTRACRSILGKMLKGTGDDCARVLQVLCDAADLNPVDPIAWIMAAACRHERTERLSDIRREWNLPVLDGVAEALAILEEKRA